MARWHFLCHPCTALIVVSTTTSLPSIPPMNTNPSPQQESEPQAEPRPSQEAAGRVRSTVRAVTMGGAARNHRGALPAGSASPPATRSRRLAAMIPVPNFIRSLFVRSEPGLPAASSRADVVDGGDTMLSPSTYHDAHTGLTPSSLWGEGTMPRDFDSPAEVASDLSSPPGARVLFQGRQGLAEDKEPAEANKESLERGEDEEEEKEASNETFSEDSVEDPKARSTDDTFEDRKAKADVDKGKPEPEASDAAAELEAEAGDDASRSNDSVGIQEVGRHQRATRTSSRLAAARARQTAAAAPRIYPILQGSPVRESRPRPEPDFEIGDWVYAEWPTTFVSPYSMKSIVFF
jgi:hypothetical protein